MATLKTQFLSYTSLCNWASQQSSYTANRPCFVGNAFPNIYLILGVEWPELRIPSCSCMYVHMCCHQVRYDRLAVINQVHLLKPPWLKERLIIANIMAIQLQTGDLLGNADLSVEVSLKPLSEPGYLITQLDSHYHLHRIKKASRRLEGVVTRHFDWWFPPPHIQWPQWALEGLSAWRGLYLGLSRCPGSLDSQHWGDQRQRNSWFQTGWCQPGVSSVKGRGRTILLIAGLGAQPAIKELSSGNSLEECLAFGNLSTGDIKSSRLFLRSENSVWEVQGVKVSPSHHTEAGRGLQTHYRYCVRNYYPHPLTCVQNTSQLL